ncbi:MAG: hypothetical protein ACRCYT_08865, partial [Cetobacterium sp.]
MKNSNLFPIITKEQEFQKIYNNSIQKANALNSRYNSIHNGTACNELDSLIKEMNDFVSTLQDSTKLEDYLTFKLLVQKIEDLLGDCNHDTVPPTEAEPDVLNAILTKTNKKLYGELLISKNGHLISSVEYELYRNNARVEKVTTTSGTAIANFNSTEPGSYYFVAKYYWAGKMKQMTSNTVVIEEEVVVP